jgi:hypothetical protein
MLAKGAKEFNVPQHEFVGRSCIPRSG